MDQESKNLEELRIDREDLDPGRSRGWFWAIVFCVVVVLLLGGLALLGSRGVAVVTVGAAPVEAVQGQRPVLNASGYVVARRQATVSSKITGKVVEILVEEGMRVEENQVLARLDQSNLQVALSLSEMERDAARAARNETQALLEEAERQHLRVSELSKEQIASASDLDRAEAQQKSLRARLAFQEAQCAVAEGQVAVWQQQLEDTIIRAPFTGIAVSKNAQPGEMISPVSAGGGFTRTGIGTIVDMNSLEIEVDVNEGYIHRVRAGQAVEAVLDAYPDWKMSSRVIAIIPTADRQKATVRVRVAFDELDPRILPEMGVKVAFLDREEVTAAEESVLLPKAAVRRREGRDVVLVLAEENRVEERPVKVGFAGQDGVTVSGGISVGEKVIVEGPEDLADGARVREKRP
jgi:RND family efflux transporter MFP subunit